MAKKPSRVSVILPTYNESGNIIDLINDIKEQLLAINEQAEVVVVDDNSPDKTGEIVRKTFAKDKSVIVNIRTKEKGLATAIRHGIEKSTGDYIVVMDTDFNHDPKMLPQFVDLLRYYDLIVGSRFTLGGGMYDNFRYTCSFIFNFFIRVVLATRIQDNLSGFFSCRRDKLLSLDFNKIFWGYGDYFFRLLFYAEKQGFSILDIPVVYLRRKSGDSKTHLLKVLFLYLKALIMLRIFAIR